MKTVGIITYHHYYNYGTMLQALALQHAVDKLGYQAELIDFKQDNSLSKAELLKLRLRRLPVYIKERKKYNVIAKYQGEQRKKTDLFEQFYQKNLCVGTKLYTNTQQLIEDPPVYDGYVVGSDQTWNPYVANAPEAFFLPFVQDDAKKGSYGPSVAVSTLPVEKRGIYREMLGKFAFLSCREQDGVKLLEDVTGREVSHVLDPTLLLDQKDWETYCTYEVPEEPYIVVYFLGEKKEHRQMVDQIRKQTGWKVITLPAAYLEMGQDTYEKVWGGPAEFLSLIKGAALVCTDSFHGTMFSINFRKNFFTFCKSSDTDETSENSRLYSALDMFGLSERIIKGKRDISTEELDISYDSVIPILEAQRKKSVEYLEHMLSEITKG